MNKESRKFLEDLLSVPSPSGFEEEIQKVVKQRMKKHCESVEIDVHGNLIASANTKGKVRVMLAGHCDQIGFMVTHIADSGYLYFRPIGGIDPTVLPGLRVQIHADKGIVHGVIGHPPVHLVSQTDRGKKIAMSKLWIDIGAASGDEVKKQISVGDAITYVNGAQPIGKHAINAPGCDDRVGLFVVMEAMRLFNAMLKDKKSCPVALFSVSTVQEEIGLRGARTSCYGIDPLVGIAVDVTHASDNPGADAKQIGTIKLGDGPTISKGANINPVIRKLLEKTAQKKKIKYQPIGSPGATGTDANAMQITRSGVAAALIGLPNRYMHTPVEVVDLRDLEAAAKLIAETVMQITQKTSFIPG